MVVLSETRTTLQPIEDQQSNAAMKKEASLHSLVMSVIKRPKSEFQTVCAFGRDNIFDNSITVEDDE